MKPFRAAILSDFLRGNPDLTDTIARLKSYQEAGADVLYAPGVTTLSDLRALVSSVDLPVNVLALPGAPSVGELAEIGVRRVSVGGAFAYAALGAAAGAGRELLEKGTYGFWDLAAPGAAAARAAFSRSRPDTVEDYRLFDGELSPDGVL